MSGHCASCGQPVEWATFASGKANPLEPGEALVGNLAAGGNPLTVRVLGPSEAPGPDETRRVSHFAFCEFANRHRRRK